MSAPLIFNGRRAKMLTQDGILRSDGSIVDNDGVPNLIKNGHAEINVTGWTVSKNTVAASRPDSGFVTSSTNITWTRNTTNPIDGQADFLYTKDAANRQGEQVYCGFTVSKKYRAKVLQIEVDYLVNSGTFSAGSSSTDSDVIVYIYDVTNSTFIEPSSFKFLSNSSTIADKFIANFQTSATGSSYRILFHQATTSASAFAVQFKDVRVSPCNYVYGTPITDWVSYTPTFGAGFGTVSTSSFYSRRVGDSLQVKGKWTNGTVAGSAATITVGYAGSNANVTIDTSKVSTNGIIGTAQTSLTSTTQFGVYPIAPSSNGTAISFTVQNSTTAFGSGAQNGNIIAASASQNSVDFSVPITGWSSSTQVSDGYDGRFIGGKFITASGSPPTSLTTVNFGTTSYDSTASYSSGTYTVPSSGWYKIYSYIGVNGATVHAGDYLELNIRRSGSVIAKTSYRAVGNYAFGGPVGATEYFTAGQTIDIQVNTSGITTPSWSAGETLFTVEKTTSPTTISATAKTVFDASDASGTIISTGATGSLISFGTVVTNTHGNYSSGIFTAQEQGDYTVEGMIQFSANSTGYRGLKVLKNNTDYRYIGLNGAPSATNGCAVSGATNVYLNAGDTLKIYAEQNSGGNLALVASGLSNYIVISKKK